MKTENLGNSKFLNMVFKPAGAMMGSKLRKWLANPTKTLHGAHIQAGQTILEVGCGTGFFTIPAAEIIGNQGSLIALDVAAGFIEVLSKKIKPSGLNNVRLIQRDALNTGLESALVDMVLLFGVIPFPLLPLNRLLPEMHRILRPGGTLAVWLFPPFIHGWVPGKIAQSGLFNRLDKQNGVINFQRR